MKDICEPLRILANCETTPRLFQIIRFKDANNDDCSLQQSSIIGSTRWANHPGGEFLWLGVGDSRMHLSRGHAIELVRVLLGWLECGNIDVPEVDPRWVYVGDSLPPTGIRVLVSDGKGIDVASLAWGDAEDVDRQEWHDTPLVPSHWAPTITLPPRDDL